jgi:1,4-dihydroxy-2-naphthoate octaprenyltransferase
MTLKTIILTARPPFLMLTPMCVFLGFGTAVNSHTTVSYFTLALILIGALSAQICSNMLNEYLDFKSGLDLATIKTPFSGGSGALPNDPGSKQAVLVVSLVALATTIIIGVYFIIDVGLAVLPIGIVGVLVVVTYTPWINKSPWLCLIAPGLGCGIMMVVGTHVTLTGKHAVLPWLISLVPFLLFNNILLLSQYPDISADKTIGRRTFPIVFGLPVSNAVYALFMLSAYSLILIYVAKGYLPNLSVIAVSPIILSLISLYGAIKYAGNIGSKPLYMGTNVAAGMLTLLMLAVSIVYSEKV